MKALHCMQTLYARQYLVQHICLAVAKSSADCAQHYQIITASSVIISLLSVLSSGECSAQECFHESSTTVSFQSWSIMFFFFCFHKIWLYVCICMSKHRCLNVVTEAQSDNFVLPEMQIKNL